MFASRRTKGTAVKTRTTRTPRRRRRCLKNVEEEARNELLNDAVETQIENEETLWNVLRGLPTFDDDDDDDDASTTTTNNKKNGLKKIEKDNEFYFGQNVSPTCAAKTPAAEGSKIFPPFKKTSAISTDDVILFVVPTPSAASGDEMNRESYSLHEEINNNIGDSRNYLEDLAAIHGIMLRPHNEDVLETFYNNSNNNNNNNNNDNNDNNNNNTQPKTKKTRTRKKENNGDDEEDRAYCTSTTASTIAYDHTNNNTNNNNNTGDDDRKKNTTILLLAPTTIENRISNARLIAENTKLVAEQKRIEATVKTFEAIEKTNVAEEKLSHLESVCAREKMLAESNSDNDNDDDDDDDNNNNNNNSNEKKCAQSLRMHAVQHLSLLSSSSSAAAADVASAEIDYDFMTGSGGEVFSPPIVLLKNNTRKKRKRASRQQQRIIIVKPDALVQRVYTSAITATAKRGTTSTKKKTRSIGKGSTKSEKETTTTTTTTTTNERDGAASSLSNIFEDETELTLALPDITISVVEHGYPKATDLIVCSSTGRERLVGCYDCGITKTPQWRQGTHGPKTLCNRCGVSWRKLNPTSRNNNK